MKNKIAVTGAAGFIGSNLVRELLAQGLPVVAIDDLSAGTLENVPAGCDFRKVDIRDAYFDEHLEGVETVFHMAAKNCLADCAESPVETSSINVAGTANVMQACIKRKVPHVVYSDTSAEYEGVLDFPSKVDRVAPFSVYACSKRGGFLAAEAIARHYGIQLSTVRYFNVYGPAQDYRRVIPPVMSAFTIKLLEGKAPFIYGTGEKRRDFIDVDDVNSFHMSLVNNPKIRGGIYNLGTGDDRTILEIFEKIEGVLKTGIRPIFKDELPGEAIRTCADVTETKATGWSPKIGLDEGIARFIAYTKKRMNLS